MTEPFIPQDDDDVVDTLSDLLDVVETSIKGTIHTGLVATVSSYDAATQTCEAKPVVKARFDNGDTFEIPVIPRIPVMFPSGGSFAITWPLEAGDFVFLSFSERSIDEWKATATTTTTPADFRRFDLSDAVAYPGLVSPRSPLLSATDDSMVIGEDNPLGLQIKIKDGKVSIGTPAAELLTEVDALANTVNNVYLTHTSVLTAIASAPPATPMTNGTFTAFYAPLAIQLAAAQAQIAAIQAKLALLKDP